MDGILNFLGGNSDALLQAGAGLLGSPDWGSGLANGLQGFSAGSQFDTQRKKEAELKANQAKLAAWAKAQGNLDPATIAALEANPQYAGAMLANKLSPKDPYRELAPGATLFDTTKNQPVFTNPDRTKELAPHYEEMYDEISKRNMKFQVYPDGTKVPVGPAPVQNRDTPPNFQAESTMARGFENQKQVQDFHQTDAMYRRIVASAQRGDTVGDIAVIFSYMKMLDPASTVREGEFATAQQAGSVPQTVVGMYNKLVTGQGSLEKGVRQQFVEASGSLYNEQAGVANKIADRERRRAQTYGLNPDNVADRVEPLQGIRPGSIIQPGTYSFKNGVLVLDGQ